MTQFLFRDDAYLTRVDARVIGSPGAEGIELDATIFYATSGGQPGDSGWLTLADGREIALTGAAHPAGDRGRILHLTEPGAPLPAAGETVGLALDWERRHRLMRMHSALHLLSVAMPFGVTGGSIGEERGRLDFDMPEPPEDIAAVEAMLNEFVEANLPITDEWITEAALDADPGMVKTMKVQPPRGQGRVRLIRIGQGAGTIDLQPCGGTHVRATGEIGALRLGKIEKKGKANRRVTLLFAA